MIKKIPNGLGKNVRKPQEGFFGLTLYNLVQSRFAETLFAETRFAETRFAETPTLTLTPNSNP